MTPTQIVEMLQRELSKLTYYYAIERDIHRLVGLVQENQGFFGNPPAGESCVKLAADKLEELIKGSKQ